MTASHSLPAVRHSLLTILESYFVAYIDVLLRIVVSPLLRKVCKVNDMGVFFDGGQAASYWDTWREGNCRYVALGRSRLEVWR